MPEPIRRPIEKRDSIVRKLYTLAQKYVQPDEFGVPIREIPITHATVRRILLKYQRRYPIWRDLRDYEYQFLRHDLPSLTNMLTERILSSRKKVRFLDVGAGEGNLKDDLAKVFTNRQLSYSGVDVIEQKNFDGTTKVYQFDLMYDRLPKDSFDFIVANFSIPYMTDKFKALQNMIDALSVNGTLVITSLGILRINNLQRSVTYGSEYYLPVDKQRNAKWLTDKLMKANPFLDIKITFEGGVIIKKLKPGVVKIPFRFIGATIPVDAVKKSLDSESTLYTLVSNYSYDELL